ncbi:MAG: methylamine dehydrogenase (amicyanin) light chain [Proteobacteria bacterium]|nr:methylamine dehydrogenase (amicyanin) light chain [Pseudomonadota bacterium]
MKHMDLLTERLTRAVAQRSSRRGFLGSLGALMVGAASLPLLPVARGAQPPAEKDHASTQDPASCEYWRHCAIDGYLCSCCGGSQSTCPPGTEQSPVTWVGTCHNPADNRDYVISYNDCCGKSTCGRCLCNRNEGDSPLYVPFQSNDYDWCAGSHSDIPYNCSTARIVAPAR